MADYDSSDGDAEEYVEVRIMFVTGTGQHLRGCGWDEPMKDAVEMFFESHYAGQDTRFYDFVYRNERFDLDKTPRQLGMSPNVNNHVRIMKKAN